MWFEFRFFLKLCNDLIRCNRVGCYGFNIFVVSVFNFVIMFFKFSYYVNIIIIFIKKW